MTTPTQLEIVDLRHFTARQMRPLLEQESEAWQRRLRWNYRSSTELLLQYLDSRILPGFVALDRGRICGYTFCVYEGHKAVIGDIYVSAEQPMRLAVTQSLARHLMEVLEASPDTDRIEAQLLLFEAGELAPAFDRSDFTVFPRLFLERNLELEASSAIAFPPEIELCRWASSGYDSAAELIHAAYVGHIDSEINDQYRTLHGSLRFLHNIVRFPGCGMFDPESSWVLRERRSGAMIALLLCSRVAHDVAHVTQLCVAPAFRGGRLGELLLRHCMERLPAQRYAALTLTVSEANASALRLYNTAGFTTRHRFDALVLDKTIHPNRFRLGLEAYSDVVSRADVLPVSSKRAKPPGR